MRTEKSILVGMVLLIGILFLTIGVSATYTRSNPAYTQFSTSTSNVATEREICEAGQDFVVQIAPFGCTPAVVRQDLLEEQNVPVFCQLAATKFNPMIDVDVIESISFSGDYPKSVQGIGFEPARSALGEDGDLNSPILNNIGNVVIVLKKQTNSSAMPDYVEGNLTAKLKYDIKSAFGIGKSSFYLPELSDAEWEENKVQYGFWSRSGYVRARGIDSNSATIDVYDGVSGTSGARKVASFNLKEGETSSVTRLSGMECLTGLQVKLTDIESTDTRARFSVNGEIVDVVEDEMFLDNKCRVTKIENKGLIQEVRVNCKGDDGSKNVRLKISPKIALNIEGMGTGSYEVGDYLYQDGDDKYVYLGYARTKGDTTNPEDIQILFLKTPQKVDRLSDNEINSVGYLAKQFTYSEATSIGLLDGIIDVAKFGAGTVNMIGQRLISGKSYEFLSYKSGSSVNPPTAIYGKDISIMGFGDPEESEDGLFEYGEVIYTVEGSGYNILGEGEDTGLYLDYDGDNDVYLLKGKGILDDATSKTMFVKSGEKYVLSKSGFTIGSEGEFFEDLASAEYFPEESKIVAKKLVTDSSDENNEFVFNYENAMQDYESILSSYSGIEFEDITFGEQALVNEISLAKSTGRKKDLVDLCRIFEQRYSDSQKPNECSNAYKLSSSEISDMEISISGETKEISFEGVFEPSLDDYSASISIEGPNGNKEIYVFGKDQVRELGLFRDDSPKTESVQLLELRDDRAKIKTNLIPESMLDKLSQATLSSNEHWLTVDVPETFGSGYTFTLHDDINLKKSAKVSIIPSILNTGTETSFTFKIGIEKRAIQLSPEKTQEKIDGLEETIESWTSKSESLGKVVKGLKAACLGVSAMLTVKNFFTNLGGTGIARKEVMRGENGWYEKCNKLVANKTYGSSDECLADSKIYNQIDADVEEYAKALDKQNEEIKKVQEGDGITKKSFLGEKVVDDEKFLKAWKDEEYEVDLESMGTDGKIKLAGDEVSVKDLNKMLENETSISRLKSIQLNSRLLNSESESLREMAQANLKSDLEDVYVNQKTAFEEASYAKHLEEIGLSGMNPKTYGDDKTIEAVYYGKKDKSGNPVEAITYKNKKYILGLEKVSGNKYIVKDIWDSNQKVIGEDSSGGKGGSIVDEIKSRFAFTKFDEDTYKNKFESSYGSSVPTVRYYETEPYKGLPAVVPFDLENGWYASMKPTLPVAGSIASYDDSGRVTSFYLCNVGENHKEEQRGGDDICEMINLGTGQPYDQFYGLSSAKTSKLVSDAVDAVEEASKKYRPGVQSITINKQSVKVGNPAVEVSELKCQDFMSPKDCLLMFNVCDPVVCPSSRCDLGGAYPVKDVIQSGIIGSIVLCLPNFKKGIFIPLCLSGIKAGIDGLLSIYTSYRDCLQESLDTGQVTGICDEIYSINLCEFFWRQSIPLSKIAIPKLFEIVLGNNVRGGGEYLNVQSAWDSAEDSVTYFTQYYAANSYKAFQARSTEEVGGEVCKSFVSATAPSGGSFLDSLTDPDSPPQFHGRFDEIPFTTKTNPPISHYKVFYHIYAGTDSRAYFKVYLKGDSGSSFYQDTSNSRIVATGYIEQGGYATETKDFTAPSGYQELCINVNGQEECGFSQVTTSFAVNYVSDKYAEQQASETDVTSEKECVAGSASIYSLLNPNLQEGVDEVINPELYNKGIIRVCATKNPGVRTDANAGMNDSRWVDVGYCDSEDMRCWLDTDSVEEVIKNSDIESDVLEKQNANYQEILKNSGKYVDGTDFDEALQKIKSAEDSEKIGLIEDLMGKVFWNSQKANLLLLRGDAYASLAKAIYITLDKGIEVGEIADDIELKKQEIEDAKREDRSDEEIAILEDELRQLEEQRAVEDEWAASAMADEEGGEITATDDFSGEFFTPLYFEEINLNDVFIINSKKDNVGAIYRKSGEELYNNPQEIFVADNSQLELSLTNEAKYVRVTLFDKDLKVIEHIYEETNLAYKNLQIPLCLDKKIKYLGVFVQIEERDEYGYFIQTDNERVFIKVDVEETGQDCGGEVQFEDKIDRSYLELPDPDISEVVFQFVDGTSARNLYYQCIDDQWRWSTTLGSWFTLERVQYAAQPPKNKNFILSLKDKSCKEGVAMLAERTKNNDEGGFFGSTALIIYYKGKRVKNYDYSSVFLSSSSTLYGIIRLMVSED